MAKGLEQATHFRAGEVVRARDPRTDDVALAGVAAYAVHRRAMVDILERFWPPSAPSVAETAAHLAVNPSESADVHCSALALGCLAC